MLQEKSTSFNPKQFLEEVKREQWYADQIEHVEHIPPRQAKNAELKSKLDPSLVSALQAAGVMPLFSHQAEAIDRVLAGENVILATPAASGKSLAYQVPALYAVQKAASARTVLLYPTKALAQDQLHSIQSLASKLTRKPSIATYDGDTPQEERSEARRSANILLTNPDMLHVGILPNHRSWSKLLQGLKYVVLDEAHVYRGVFGSHVANVLRRLRRICEGYGSHPQFIFCSATLANPAEHAQNLVGLPFSAITEDGSPSGGKEFALWNPPLIDKARSSRRSSNSESTHLFASLVSKGVRTITFARTRKLTELIYIYTRERLGESGAAAASRIRPYRAGYRIEERRQIEKELFEGRLLGVTSTSALELGIDIGGLDATILTGYPGSIASAWQQAGRSGRRGGESLSVMVAMDNPLDQYFMRNPKAFFGKPQENAITSHTNPHILRSHLLCAAYERPLTQSDASYFGEQTVSLASELTAESLMRPSSSGRQWYLAAGIDYPAQDINIRSTSAGVYTVIEEGTGRLLETVTSEQAFAQIHPGAIYLHQGNAFLVTSLDIQSKSAYARQTDDPFYTQSSDVTDIRILRVLQEKRVGPAKLYLGEVDVSKTVVSYKKKRQLTEEIVDEQALNLPTQSFPTVAFWWDISPELQRQIRAGGLDFPGSLHAAEHASIGMLPLFALCERNDIGGVSTPMHPDTGQPQVFIYDGHVGGVGIAEKGYELVTELWEATLKVINDCVCESGCPSCIQSPKCGNNNEPLDKKGAAILLKSLLGRS